MKIRTSSILASIIYFVSTTAYLHQEGFDIDCPKLKSFTPNGVKRKIVDTVHDPLIGRCQYVLNMSTNPFKTSPTALLVLPNIRYQTGWVGDYDSEDVRNFDILSQLKWSGDFNWMSRNYDAFVTEYQEGYKSIYATKAGKTLIGIKTKKEEETCKKNLLKMHQAVVELAITTARYNHWAFDWDRFDEALGAPAVGTPLPIDYIYFNDDLTKAVFRGFPVGKPIERVNEGGIAGLWVLGLYPSELCDPI